MCPSLLMAADDFITSTSRRQQQPQQANASPSSGRSERTESVASNTTSNTTSNSNSNNNGSTAAANSNLATFCREVRNLLRSKPNCMIPFSKFVPAYHNHYGRQCCVYQFGYTKLIELLEAIPHVVQIIGDGSATNRYITLTHREQIKRFASDLIKVVKSQPGKRLRLSQFARAYEHALGRTFRVEDYGTNNINVLLAEIWEGTINIIPISREPLAKLSQEAAAALQRRQQQRQCHEEPDAPDGHSCPAEPGLRGPLFVNVPAARQNPVLEQLIRANELVNKPYITHQYPDCWFEIPRRERSDKEIKRTRYFIWDCIELLSKMKQNCYAVPFSKFIPAYHYYFNRQCKVSIFGFSKLIDLFESISPSVVEILDQGPGEEKLIRLARKYWPKQGPAKRQHHQLATMTSGDAKVRRYNSGRSGANYVIMSSSAVSMQRKAAPTPSPRQAAGGTSADEFDEVEDEEDEEEEQEDEEEEQENEGGLSEEEALSEEEEADDEQQLARLDREQRAPRRPELIDCGPTEEELLELEHELAAYEEQQAIQRKRSGRMAAILDIFKHPIY